MDQETQSRLGWVVISNSDGKRVRSTVKPLVLHGQSRGLAMDNERLFIFGGLYTLDVLESLRP